jgi:two-component system LytT family response regulator
MRTNPRMSPTANQTSRVLIVEDEVHARRFLRELLAAEPGVSIVGEAADGAEGAEMVKALSPDLVFLDIQMPELDGFEMIARVGVEEMPAFVLVTAFSEHAARAFEVQALDYLCKPFDRDRLRFSLQRFYRHRAMPTESVDQHGPVRKIWRRRLAIKQGSGVLFIPVEQVLWIEAANKYVIIRTSSQSYISRQTIQSIVDELSPEQFVRTSRSIVVRKNAVREVKPLFHGDHIVYLTDGTELALSRNYREKFFSEMAR